MAISAPHALCGDLQLPRELGGVPLFHQQPHLQQCHLHQPG